MLTKQRKAHILEILNRHGQVVAKAVSKELGLSEDTIRRDLRELATEGLLQRVHGGALPVSPAIAGFTDRQQLASAGKSAIGQKAAQLVQPGQLIFLDGGTTAVQLARHLPHNLAITVLTHSPSIAVELVSNPGVTVELIGGKLFKHSIVTVGVATMEAVGRFYPDIFFMGVTGVHPDHGLTTGDSEEAAVKRALCYRSAETIVLASNEKIGAVSPFVVVPLVEVDSVIVDNPVSSELLQRLLELGVSVIQA
jgi:DeoR/GlpR family transcriptional regulator of sugar metabolism